MANDWDSGSWVTITELRVGLETPGGKALAVPWPATQHKVSMGEAVEWLEKLGHEGGVVGVRARFLLARLLLRATSQGGK